MIRELILVLYILFSIKGCYNTMEEHTPRPKEMSHMTNLEVELVAEKKYKNVQHLTLVVMSLCLASFYFGFCLCFLSNVSSDILQQYFGQSAGSSVVIGGLIGAMPIGAAFGAISAPFFMRCLSRKHFLLVFNAGAILVAGIIQINNIGVLFACRLLQGFLVGNFMAITPIYINQLVPVDIQGSFGALTQLFVIIAVVLCYFFGVVFQVNNVDGQFIWRFLFSFTGITAIIQSLFLIFDFIPQSPVSLVEAGKIDEAKQVLALFNTPDVLNKVLNQTIAKASKKKQKVPIDETQYTQKQTNPQQKTQEQAIQVSKRAIFLGFELPFMQQLSGINMIVTEIGSIVGTYDNQMALYAPLIANIIQLIATFFAVMALAHFGRRTLILFGNLSLALIDIIVAVLFLVLAITGWTPAVYIALVFIMIFMISYGVTIGPAVWLYVPEIIPANLVPPATFMNWFGCSICVIVTPFIVDAVGSPYPVFFFFGGVSLIFGFVNHALLIQTKGLSLLEIAKKLAS